LNEVIKVVFPIDTANVQAFCCADIPCHPAVASAKAGVTSARNCCWARPDEGRVKDRKMMVFSKARL